MSISFTAPLIPHIDVDVPILKDGDKYIVTGVSMPLGGGGMKINAARIEYISFERWENG